MQAISKFKDALISSMDDKSRGEALVSSAINRTLYPQSSSVTAEDEDPQEKAVMQALSRMLNDLSKKTHDAHGQASHPPKSSMASSVQQQQPSEFPTIVQGPLPPHLPQPPPPMSQQQGAHTYAQHMYQIGDHYPIGGAVSQIHPGVLNAPAPTLQHETTTPVQQPSVELISAEATGVTSSGTNDAVPAASTSAVPKSGSELMEAKHVLGKRKLEEDEAGDKNDREAKKVHSGEREGDRLSPKNRPK